MFLSASRKSTKFSNRMGKQRGYVHYSNPCLVDFEATSIDYNYLKYSSRNTFESQHDKINKMICAPIEGSDHFAHHGTQSGQFLLSALRKHGSLNTH